MTFCSRPQPAAVAPGVLRPRASFPGRLLGTDARAEPVLGLVRSCTLPRQQPRYECGLPCLILLLRVAGCCDTTAARRQGVGQRQCLLAPTQHGDARRATLATVRTGASARTQTAGILVGPRPLGRMWKADAECGSSSCNGSAPAALPMGPTVCSA